MYVIGAEMSIAVPDSIDVELDWSPPRTLVTGQVALTSTTVAKSLGGNRPLRVGVRVRASLTNAGNVYVGISGVTTTVGYALAQGESVFIPIDNMDALSIAGANVGDGVSFIGS